MEGLLVDVLYQRNESNMYMLWSIVVHLLLSSIVMYLNNTQKLILYTFKKVCTSI